MTFWLVSATVRSLCFVLPALLILFTLRVKSPAAQHAALTVITGGMLMLSVITIPSPILLLPVLPPKPLPKVDTRSTKVYPGDSSKVVSPPAARREADWGDAISAMYCAGLTVFISRLVLGYWTMRKVLRNSRDMGEFRESNIIHAPMTLGLVRPNILLPVGWNEWSAAKKEVVLVHERTHVRRKDWAIAVLAALNQAVFWYNPLSWWLQRRLATLAELACDDATILKTGRRDCYAAALLDIAADVHRQQGRFQWQGVGMAKESQVSRRVHRILNEERQLSNGLSAPRWMGVVAVGICAVTLSGALQLTRAQVRAPRPFKDFHTEYRLIASSLTAQQVADLERRVAQNPDDVDARTRLIFYYLNTAKNAERAKHVLWMIEHHPEADVHQTVTLFAEDGPLQDLASYRRAVDLWLAIAQQPTSDTRVTLNAAYFLEPYFAFNAHDLYSAEKWILKAREIEPQSRFWASQLAYLYTLALEWEAAGETSQDHGFAEHAKNALGSTQDASLLGDAAFSLTRIDSANKNQKMIALQQLGQELIQKAEEMGYRVPSFPPGGEVNSPAAAENGSSAPERLHRVDAVYPPEAKQARIEGVVSMRVLIGRDGLIQRLELISGHPLLVPPAREAVQQWVFPPQTSPTWINVEVPFRQKLVPSAPVK